jgi:hypothetical protein
LFDAIGLPLLRLSAPIYLHLADRPKIRGAGVSSGFDGGGGGGGESGGGAPEVFAVAPAPDIGNMSAQVGVHLTSGLVVPLPFAAFPGAAQVPEPSTLWLLAPAFLFALRRRFKPRRS